MKLYLIVCFQILLVFSINAQFDPEAKDIIKPISEAVLNSSGVSVDFVLEMENKQDGTNELDSGKLLLKGNKYALELLGTKTYFNGETQWVYMIDEMEVNISNPEYDGGFEFTPQSIFTMYEEGFRFKIIDDATEATVIEMFPDDRELPFFKIQLVLNTVKKTFDKVTAFGRDGLTTTVSIYALKKGLNINESEFVFNETNFPDVEIIDMR